MGRKSTRNSSGSTRSAQKQSPIEPAGTATQSSEDEMLEEQDEPVVKKPTPKRQKRASVNGQGESSPANSVTSPSKPTNTPPSRPTSTITAGANSNPGASFAVLLSQAIQSGDEERVAVIITRTDIKQAVITRTVEELQTSNVLPFLQMVEKMMREEKIADFLPWMNWLQSILTAHATYLSSISDLGTKVGLLVEWMERRVRNMDKLLRLQGKLELVSQQMTIRSQPTSYARVEPIMEMDI